VCPCPLVSSIFHRGRGITAATAIGIRNRLLWRHFTQRWSRDGHEKKRYLFLSSYEDPKLTVLASPSSSA
jgi:hypothetical protein